MLYLICGTSSVGKSTYIESASFRSLSNLSHKMDLKFAFEFEKDPNTPLTTESVIHYNIMNKCRSDALQNRIYDYTFGTLLDTVFDLQEPTTVIILVASKKRILARIAERTIIEKQFTSNNTYNSDFWEDLYKQINLTKLYLNFCAMLTRKGIDYLLIDSNATYKTIQLDEVASVINEGVPLIVSVHIRKAAGSSFRKSLQTFYGKSLLLDYGDEITSSQWSSKYKRLLSKLRLRKKHQYVIKNYSIIHGHFFAPKYDNLNTNLQYITFLRDPVDRVLSNYYYLKRSSIRSHGDSQVIHKKEYTLEQYIVHPDARNVQTQFLDGKPLSSFDFVGLSANYEKSIKLFNSMFSANLVVENPENTNPNKASDYQVSDAIIALIKKNNLQDIELYEKGKQLFEEQCQKYL